ncbi:MAG TPA: RDD family protein [Miltoncostaea sp.]|nr:RDD family protein [Miltoncostaea sp.]
MVSDAVLGAAERVVRPRPDDGRPLPAAPVPVTARIPLPTRLPVPAAPVRGVGGLAARVVAGVAPAVIERLDLNAIVQRVDLDRVLERVDVNRILARVDVDALLERVDPNTLVERIDIDRVVSQVDMGSVAREAIDGLDLGEIVRESTMGVGGDAIRDARAHAMRADRALERAVDRPLGREERGAVIPAPGRASSRAGLLSRAAAVVVDSLVVVLIGLVLLIIAASLRLLWSGAFSLGFADAIGVRAGALVLLFAYLTYGWGLDGRTVGMQLMGLRVLDEDGSDLSFPRAGVRALLCMVFPIGLLWSLVSRRDASVQDLIVSTVVVHDWGRERTPERPAHRRETR